MVRFDRRDRVPVADLRDPRVVQLWDADHALGRWYEAEVTRRGAGIEWDAFFVYPPGARWDPDGARPTAWGRTVIGKGEQLRAALLPLLAP
jgi:hypothetical protein